MKNIIHIFLKTLIILIIVQFIYQPVCHAADGFLDGIINAGNNFIKEGENQVQNSPVVNETEFKDNFNNLYGALFVIGIICIVLVGAILGIKFIIGSVEEQAKVKEYLIPYFAGTIIIMGAFGIWRVIILLFAELTQ